MYKADTKNIKLNKEILFTGLIAGVIALAISGTTAMISSYSVIAVFHMNLIQGTAAFFNGIIFCIVFYYSKSLIPGIVAHAFLNLGTILINLLNKMDLAMSVDINIVILGVLYIVIIILYTLVKRTTGLNEKLNMK